MKGAEGTSDTLGIAMGGGSALCYKEEGDCLLLKGKQPSIKILVSYPKFIKITNLSNTETFHNALIYPFNMKGGFPFSKPQLFESKRAQII